MPEDNFDISAFLQAMPETMSILTLHIYSYMHIVYKFFQWLVCIRDRAHVCARMYVCVCVCVCVVCVCRVCVCL